MLFLYLVAFNEYSFTCVVSTVCSCYITTSYLYLNSYITIVVLVVAISSFDFYRLYFIILIIFFYYHQFNYDNQSVETCILI